MCLHTNTHNTDTGVSMALPQQCMDASVFENLARQTFPTLDRVILYGVGEPLMHPGFLSLLKISRQYLPEHGCIEFTTNGSLLAPATLDAMRPYNLARIIVSLDSPFNQKNEKLRQGFSQDVMDNITHLSQSHGQGHPQAIAIETVVSRANLYDLPYLVQYCHDIGMPNLYVSHLHPYSDTMASLALYTSVSQRAFEIMMDIAKSGWETVSRILLLPMYAKTINTETHPRLQTIFRQLDKARHEGVDIDLQKLTTLFQQAPQISETQEVFAEAQGLAEKLKINLKLPPLFVDPDKRACPFIAYQALFVTVDGTIVPCYNLAHPHSLYINRHHRQESPYQLGNISQSFTSLASLCAAHAPLFSRLQSMPQTVPWCGDCIYSTQNCYYVQNNESDCLGNQPSCNECLYSTGFVKCLFD
jgi:MoaA/NifB/PqqE/SkfB family radical SAM enzyme